MTPPHEDRLDRHGRTLAEHDVRLDVSEQNIGYLWKQKVSLERYIWVERVVMGGCGAALYWVFQVLSAR